MKLPVFQAQRFFYLFDQLCMYAHERLHVVTDEEFYNGEPPRGIGEVAQRETSLELWNNKRVIDDFVRENPAGLSKDDLAIVATWKHAFTCEFFAMRGLDGRFYLVAHKHAFALCGISHEPDQGLFQAINLVHTTLLPFREYVVYAMFMKQYPVDLGPNIAQSARESLDEALAAGHVISTGAQLMSVEPTLSKKRADEKLERFRHEMEMEERSHGPHEGQHEGTLAGLSEEERQKAILERRLEALQERHDELLREHDELVREILDDLCLAGPVTTSLKDILELIKLPSPEDTKAMFSDMFDGTFEKALDNVLEQVEDIRDDLDSDAMEEINALTGQLKSANMLPVENEADVRQLFFDLYTKPSSLAATLSGMRRSEVECVRELIDAGGRKVYGPNELDAALDLPRWHRELCCLFKDGDAYVAIMPDEVLAAARQIDWEELTHKVDRHQNLVRFFDAIAELRGVLPLAEAGSEYFELFPEDDRDMQSILDELMYAVEDDESSACFLDTGDEFYLVHYLLQIERRKEFGEDAYSLEVCDEGEPGDLVSWILEEHRRKEPRRVTRDMLDGSSLFDWKSQRPAALSMRDYLDRHVPDERDDHYFADKVLEEIFEEVCWGQPKEGVDRLFEILENNDFYPDESQLNTILNLWNNLYNSLPNWPNNGWAPNELVNRGLGKRVFFNPDGSPMRVGRNDPCPCGSGKKYKRCCGR